MFGKAAGNMLAPILPGAFEAGMLRSDPKKLVRRGATQDNWLYQAPKTAGDIAERVNPRVSGCPMEISFSAA
jgi:hypothetical protein